MSEARLATGILSAPSSADPRLLVGCYRLNFASGAPIRFSEFPGSAWRGALGHALARLAYFHGDAPLETDFKGLTSAARALNADAALQWREQVRYSARQRSEMKLGGVVGALRIDGQDLSPFWPYLWLGQWTHAGAAATMGNGVYQLASLPFERSSAAADRMPQPTP